MTSSDANASNVVYGFEMLLRRGGQSGGNALACIREVLGVLPHEHVGGWR
jgi:hypothetical protein